MKNLILMRGAMGSGKSSFLKTNNLEQYTLCPDTLRLYFQTPIMSFGGNVEISQKNDNKVWKLLFELLEERMSRGEFTIIDATHTSTKSINAYRKLCSKYKYRCFVLDFSDVPMELALERNKNRETYKFVPEKAIKMAYSRFETQKVPSFAKLISRDEFKKTIQYTQKDLSNYKKIHFIGDIHGCYEPIKEYFSNELSEDEFYIFLGDYIDRGLQNKEVLEFLLSIYEKQDVLLLEGNHEKWLWYYANDEIENIKSKTFLSKTMAELNTLDKKELRKLYRKFAQIAYLKYNEKEVIVTHGGIPYIPNNLTMISTDEFIKGVGRYEDNIGEIFKNNCKENQYNIYGHRNIQGFPTQVNENSFNLQGDIEFGGDLRIVTLDSNGFDIVEIKNNIFDENIKPKFKKSEVKIELDIDWINDLRNSKYITEKTFGNISSFNFNKKAWYKKVWNEHTITARGLFVNINIGNIVARSYNKFFNIGENSSNSLGELKGTLKFPITLYEKSNGYLGIVGYDKESDELIITSKSSLDGDYAETFRNLFYKKFNNRQIDFIKKLLKNNNMSLVFEVIEPNFDPHIIKYNEPKLVLLDCIYREINFKKVNYKTLKEIAMNINCEIKKKSFVFNNWTDFCEWYYPAIEDISLEIEGYVIEDSDMFMAKIKLPYYRFWKKWRGFKDGLKKNPNINGRMLNSELDGKFYNFLKKLNNEDLDLDIITLRERFYKI